MELKYKMELVKKIVTQITLGFASHSCIRLPST